MNDDKSFADDVDLVHDEHLAIDGDLDGGPCDDSATRMAAASKLLTITIDDDIHSGVNMAATSLPARSNGQLDKDERRVCFFTEVLKRLCDCKS